MQRSGGLARRRNGYTLRCLGSNSKQSACPSSEGHLSALPAVTYLCGFKGKVQRYAAGYIFKTKSPPAACRAIFI